MATLANITRRRILKSIPAVGVTAIVPAAAAAIAPEHPATRMHEAARDLRAAMVANDDAPGMIIVYADKSLTHPIAYCENNEYVILTQLMWAYREAHREVMRQRNALFAPNEVTPLPERPEHKPYWDAFHKRNLAHYRIIDAMNEMDIGVTIDA